MSEDIPAGMDLWSCGHIAGAMCQQCYRELAQRSGGLAEEGRQLREQMVDLLQENNAAIRALREQLLTVTQERDEAWAKIDQLIGRMP